MIEYLVRWKFAPNSLLNKRDVETHWYKQFCSDKEEAVKHYADLMKGGKGFAITVEIFMLTQLMHGDSDVPIVVQKSTGAVAKIRDLDEPVKIKGKDYKIVKSVHDRNERNKKIVAMHTKGYSRKEIATQMGLSYQTVYAVTRKYVAS